MHERPAERRIDPGMLLVFIPIALLAVAVLLVALCRLAASADVSAASADQPTTSANQDAPVLSLHGLTVWDSSDPVAVLGAARALSAFCAAMNPGTEAGAMPAKVFENMRPTLIAGFAKLAELVKK